MLNLERTALLVELIRLTDIFQSLHSADIPTEGRMHYKHAQWLLSVTEGRLQEGFLADSRRRIREIKMHLSYLTNDV